MIRSIYIISLCSLAMMLSCANDKTGRLANYYPALSDGTSEVVREYRSTGVMQHTEYWHVHNAGDNKVVTTIYDQSLQRVQEVVEKIAPDGCNIMSLTLWNYDQNLLPSKTEARIIADDLFPYNPQDSLFVYLTHYEWEDRESNDKLRVYRNRRYFGETMVRYADNEVEAVVFHVGEVIEDVAEGTLAIETSGYEYFVEGLGMVKRTKHITEGLDLDMELVKSYSLTDLKETNEQLYDAINAPE